MSTFIIDKAILQEMDFFLAQAKAEGWNPGLSDAIPFYYTDPNGFFIGKLDGKMIGCISAIAYDNKYGFMGFYIVMPEYRGRGYGLKLWNHAIAYLGDRSIGLDGVVAQQENYKKSGFKLFYNNIRYAGKRKGRKSVRLKEINEIPFQSLVDFDTPIFGINRSHFLRLWIQMPGAYGLAKEIHNRLAGYGLIRQCKIGHKIGPLFADDFETAEEIFHALLVKCKGNEVFFDMPQTNPHAKALAEKNDLKIVFETARMYRGTPPKQESQKVFGVTTFELG